MIINITAHDTTLAGQQPYSAMLHEQLPTAACTPRHYATPSLGIINSPQFIKMMPSLL